MGMGLPVIAVFLFFCEKGLLTHTFVCNVHSFCFQGNGNALKHDMDKLVLNKISKHMYDVLCKL